MKIAIVGATGNVGRKIIEVLEQKKLLVEDLCLLASKKSAGTELLFNGKKIKVQSLEDFDFSKVDITFFSAGKKISEAYAVKAAKCSVVVDNSSYFRMDPDVPLIVPQVNKHHLSNLKKNIIANPNCSTAQMVIVLKPLHDLFDIKRVVVSTYQSVSGAGKASMDELIEQTRDILAEKKVSSKNFTKQIAFNAIPHIDDFLDDGYTKEEIKMINETKKILDHKIELTATCVRIPVMVSHSESLNIEFNKTVSLSEVRKVLAKAPGCKIIDDPLNNIYATPIDSAGKNETFISRIRQDNSNKNSINLWIVSDNLLRGAALNAVEIAETYYNKLQ